MYKLLSVDDEPINQAIVEELFNDKFDVILALSGEECIQNINNTKPDLILLDVSMVGMDGYDTCRQLKKVDETRHIPIIFVSARGSFEDKIKAYDAGGQDYITKPFNHSELEAVIKDTIKSNQNSASDTNQPTILHQPLHKESTTPAIHDFKSDSGIIIQFLRNCNTCTTLNKLSEILIEFCQDRELSCIFQFRTKLESFVFTNQKQVSSLEQLLLAYATDTEHFFNFSSGTIITYPHISLLIKNMPAENSHYYDQLKRIFEVLVEGVETKVKSLSNEIALNPQNNLFSK